MFNLIFTLLTNHINNLYDWFIIHPLLESYNMMLTLIYYSTACDSFKAEDLNVFLTSIRLKNFDLDVTGILLYHEGDIMQIIEGEKATIITLYESIKKDDRHTNIVKLIDFKMSERAFEDWSMAFKKISKKDWVTVQGYLSLDKQAMRYRIVQKGSI